MLFFLSLALVGTRESKRAWNKKPTRESKELGVVPSHSLHVLPSSTFSEPRHRTRQTSHRTIQSVDSSLAVPPPTLNKSEKAQRPLVKKKSGFNKAKNHDQRRHSAITALPMPFPLPQALGFSRSGTDFAWLGRGRRDGEKVFIAAAEHAMLPRHHPVFQNSR